MLKNKVEIYMELNTNGGDGYNSVTITTIFRKFSWIWSRGSTSLGENTWNSKDLGYKSSSLFRTSVLNVRRIKSDHHKNFKKVKITTSKVQLWH